jgi:hypothetical protein
MLQRGATSLQNPWRLLLANKLAVVLWSTTGRSRLNVSRFM